MPVSSFACQLCCVCLCWGRLLQLAEATAMPELYMSRQLHAKVFRWAVQHIRCVSGRVKALQGGWQVAGMKGDAGS